MATTTSIAMATAAHRSHKGLNLRRLQTADDDLWQRLDAQLAARKAHERVSRPPNLIRLTQRIAQAVGLNRA